VSRMVTVGIVTEGLLLLLLLLITMMLGLE